MSKLIALFVIVGAFAIVGCATPSPVLASHSPTACMEDAACWNWATMGDHRRGVVTTDGARVVVSVCSFRRMVRAGRVDFASALGRMKGDASAMRYARCP